MRISVGSRKFVEIVSARDPVAESFEEPLDPSTLAWHIRSVARNGSAGWQLRGLVELSGTSAANLDEAELIEEAVRQVNAGALVGRMREAPRLSYGVLGRAANAVYASPGALPVGAPPRLTDKCSLASYCEEQFRLAAKEGIARVDCPVLNGGQCPT